jgi:GNAT superfamily N-acetyltransferase
MNFNIRPGNPRDQGFVCSRLLNGSRNGHFHIDVDNKQKMQTFRAQVGRALQSTQTNPHSVRSIYIAESAAQRIGIAIVDFIDPYGFNREIHAMSILPEYQGRGYGSALLDQLLEKLQICGIYVRCGAASETMYQMLLHRCFRYLRTTEGGYRVVKRETLDPRDLMTAQPEYHGVLIEKWLQQEQAPPFSAG